MNVLWRVWRRLLRRIDQHGEALRQEAMRRHGWVPVRQLRELGIKEQKHG